MVHTLILLQRVPYPTGFFLCNLCREKGSGAVFHCSACHFDLHPSCIATGEEISHFSHFKHPLYIETLDGSKSVICDVCGAPAFPTVYHCDECNNFDMHPHCARAPRFVQHSCHNHILQLIPKSDAYSDTCWCDACGKEATDLVYHCSSCDFDLHISCAMLPCNPFHSKHPQHRLKLFSQSDTPLRKASCEECGKDASNWSYECEPCGFYLHVDCANIPGHEAVTLPVSPLGYTSSSATSSDIQEVVKLMDRVLVSSAQSVTSNEEAAAQKVMKMLELQQQIVPVLFFPTASRLIRDEDQSTCPACLEDYTCEKQRRDLQCGHHFHTGCILRWLDSSNRCPVCRRQVMFTDGA